MKTFFGKTLVFFPLFASWACSRLVLWGGYTNKEAMKRFGVLPQALSRWQRELEEMAPEWHSTLSSGKYHRRNELPNTPESFAERGADVWDAISFARFEHRWFPPLHPEQESLFVDLDDEMTPRPNIAETVRFIGRSISEKRPFTATYRPRMGEQRVWIVSPHRFVWARNRLHVRCATSDTSGGNIRFLDLLPSRFVDRPNGDAETETVFIPTEEDVEWRQWTQADFFFSPQLSAEHREAALKSFGFGDADGVRVVFRKACEHYVFQELSLRGSQNKAADRSEKPWIFWFQSPQNLSDLSGPPAKRDMYSPIPSESDDSEAQ